MTAPADIVNQAIGLIGDNTTPVTGNLPTFDNSAAGIAAGVLYQPTVQTVARKFGWDFSRNTVALTLSGGAAPFPWALEYLYPTNGVQVRQLLPPALTDPNDPLPVNWAVAYNLVGNPPQQQKVIHANLASALAVFTGQPNENTWDALFRESVVRLLASGMAMWLFGKPDTAKALIESGELFEQIGMTRDS